jgi:hypothetical protein
MSTGPYAIDRTGARSVGTGEAVRVTSGIAESISNVARPRGKPKASLEN